jgi:SAM-dependent methyltransferase
MKTTFNNINMSSELLKRETSKEFYEDRFERGYMDEWPEQKLQRILEVLQLIKLPAKGVALDFGCGQGVLAEVLQKALPGWEIHGCDLSEVAVDLAKSRYPRFTFFVSGDSKHVNQKYDLIFTHHVLEHVYNLKDILGEIEVFANENSSVLHVLPCGNPGSFEYDICKSRADGINPDMGNRFFFEDPGHVRRMQSDELAAEMANYGYMLSNAYFCNHYYGALNWISRSHPKLIRKFTDPEKALDEKAAAYLKSLRSKLNLLYKLQFGVMRIKGGTDWKGFVRPRTSGSPIKKILARVYDGAYYAASMPFYWFIDFLDKNEWKTKKEKKNGSEMFLFFKKSK